MHEAWSLAGLAGLFGAFLVVTLFRWWRCDKEVEKWKNLAISKQAELNQMHQAVVDANNARIKAEDKAVLFQARMTTHLNFCRAYDVSIRARRIPIEQAEVEVEYWHTEPTVDVSREPEVERIPIKRITFTGMVAVGLSKESLSEYVARDISDKVKMVVLREYQKFSMLWPEEYK